MIANSRMDAVDVVDLHGRLVNRRYLWDLSAEIMELGLHRADRVADICHLNHICDLAGEIVLTLGNLNGTRQGALMSYRTGAILAGDFAFPHDGRLIEDGVFAVTESGTGRLTLLSDVRFMNDLRFAERRCFPSEGCWGGVAGRIWVRGLAASNGFLLLGRSKFDEISANPAPGQPTNILVLQQADLRPLGRVDLPRVPALDQPVIYSILAYESDDGPFDPTGSPLLQALPEREDCCVKEKGVMNK